MAQTQISGDGIKANAITNAHLHSSASISATKLADSGVTAGSYGSATAIPAITVNEKGILTAVSTNSVNTTTNLSTSTSTTAVTIASSTGNNASISEASSSAAGVMSVAHHDKLDGIAASATNNGSGNAITDGDKGEISVSNSGGTFTIDNGVINNAKIASNASMSLSKLEVITSNRIVGNDSGNAVPKELTAAQVRTIINVENGATADQSNSEIKTAYEANSNTNAFTDALLSKLNGIAASATNVTNTNQLTNGAGFITATLTNEQVQDIVGGMVSGNTESGITVTYQDGDGTLDFSVASQTDQNFTTTLKNKLDGIEAGATADQSASEILTLLKTVDGAGSGLAADTLDGVSSTQFLRSDTADTASGDITFSGGAGAATIGANSDIRFNSGNWTGDACKIQQHGNSLYIQGGSNSSYNIILRSNSGSDRLYMNASGHFYPATASATDLGLTGARFRNIYADTLYGDGSNLTGISTFSGSYNDLSNKPTIPTNNNQLTNGAGYVTSSGNTVIGTDSDINTSGATVVDQLNMTDGVITSHSTRTLTLANLGYTGATNANRITNNNQITNGRGFITNVHSSRNSGSNGFVRYRDGTQISWGNMNLVNTGFSTKSFATAFPSACRACIVCPNDSTATPSAQRNPLVRNVNRNNFQSHSGQNTNPCNHFFIAVGV